MNEPSFGSPAAVAAAGAVCPSHPERASVATCARCGRFLCGECRVLDAPPSCAQCRARNRDALGLGASGMTVGNTLRFAFLLLRAAAPAVAVVVLVGAAVGTALELALPDLSRSVSRLVDRVYEFTVGMVLTTSVVAAMLHAAEGERLAPGAALQEGLNSYGRVLKWRFLSGLYILAFTLLLIVPGILKALSFAFVGILAWKAVPDPLGASEELTHGKRARLLGVLTCAFLVFLVALVVPIAVAGGLSGVLPGLDVPVTVFSNLCINLGERFLDASVVAAYLLLSNELVPNRAA